MGGPTRTSKLAKCRQLRRNEHSQTVRPPFVRRREASIGTVDPGDKQLLHAMKQATRETQGGGEGSFVTGLRLSSSLLDLALHVQTQLHTPTFE